MTREEERIEEFEELKNTIEAYYDDARCGIYNSQNVLGDKMKTLFRGEYFSLDICWNWEYFEVFGTSKEEFELLEKFYKSLRETI